MASGDIAQFQAFAAAHPDCALYAGLAATMLDLLSAQAAAVESSQGLEDILALREQEVAALRQQLGEVTRILDSTAEADAARDAQIDRLGAELNAALARAALAERARAEREAAEAARQAEALAAQSEAAATAQAERDARQAALEAELQAAIARAAAAEQALAELTETPQDIVGPTGSNGGVASARAPSVFAPTGSILRTVEPVPRPALESEPEEASVVATFRPGARPDDLDLVATIDPTMSVHETRLLGRDRRIVCSDAVQCASWYVTRFYEDPEAFRAYFFGRATSRSFYHLELPFAGTANGGRNLTFRSARIGTGDTLVAALNDAGIEATTCLRAMPLRVASITLAAMCGGPSTGLGNPDGPLSQH